MHLHPCPQASRRDGRARGAAAGAAAAGVAVGGGHQARRHHLLAAHQLVAGHHPHGPRGGDLRAHHRDRHLAPVSARSGMEGTRASEA